jgi:hypothetical protein
LPNAHHSCFRAVKRTLQHFVSVLWGLQDKQPVWEALLKFAVANGVDALVDCGALLAGASNR